MTNLADIQTHKACGSWRALEAYALAGTEFRVMRQFKPD